MAHHDVLHSFDTDWEDRVAAIDEKFYWSSAEREAFANDIGELVSDIVEGTIAPIRGLIEDLPQTTPFDLRQWRGAWRAGRRRWRRWNRT